MIPEEFRSRGEAFRTQRDQLLQKAPRWLRQGNLGRLVYTIGLHMDGLVDIISASILYRFPGLYGPGSLPFLGRDRRIPRGLSETSEGYADRLTQWWDYHAKRGNPYELLRQLHAFYTPDTFEVDLVYSGSPTLGKTLRLHMAIDGTITKHEVLLSSWSPHGDPGQWARWWLFIHQGAWTIEDRWGDGGTWGDGGVWGSGLSRDRIEELRTIPRDWNAGRSIGRLIILDTVDNWDDLPPNEFPFQIYID